MKKYTISFFILIGMFVFNLSHAYAQCSIIGTDSTGTIISIPISCNFPVHYNSGDEQADAARYKSDKAFWVANYPDDYSATLSVNSSFIQIHQTDLNAMEESRRIAILARPEEFHVIP